MLILAYILAIPLAYFATLVILLVKRDMRGIAYSLAMFGVAVFAMWWDITRSRSSTAGIGFLFLPLTASVAGFGGLAFGRWRYSEILARRVFGWLGLACAVGLIAVNVVEGRRRIEQNSIRDNQQAMLSAEIARDREEIDASLKANAGRERVWLDSAIRARMADRSFLLAALPHDSISPEVIDTVAYSSDLGVTLEALRNPNARAETLARVYRTASYPDYFYQALASHRNTPDSVLRKLHQNPGVMVGLDVWLAGNPSTPKDVLVDIGHKTIDRQVIAALLENPAADCKTISALAENLMKKQNRSADNPSVEKLTQRLPAVCANTPAG